jgi:hypothetical protein
VAGQGFVLTGRPRKATSRSMAGARSSTLWAGRIDLGGPARLLPSGSRRRSTQASPGLSIAEFKWLRQRERLTTIPSYRGDSTESRVHPASSGVHVPPLADRARHNRARRLRTAAYRQGHPIAQCPTSPTRTKPSSPTSIPRRCSCITTSITRPTSTRSTQLSRKALDTVDPTPVLHQIRRETPGRR